jgi:hypothetical protein
MAIYAVKYNPSGEYIPGATQIGTLAVAIGEVDYTTGGWYGGVDDELGYVIYSDTTSLNLVDRTTASGSGIAQANKPTFYRSKFKTDESLLELINRIPGNTQSFNDINDAKTWLANTSHANVIDGSYSVSGSSGTSGTSGTNSGVTLTIQESGADVVWSYSGSLDLSNLTLGGTQTMAPGFNAGSAEWAAGPNVPTTIQLYTGASFVFPASFGGAGGAPASNGIGDILGVIGGGLGRTLLVPDGYVSNTLISGSTTYLNSTLSSLGLTEGTYTYSWGSGTNESITVLIGGTPSGTSGNSGSGLGEWSFYSDEGPINAMPPTGNGQLMITGNTDNGTVETYDPNYDPDDEVIWSKYIAINLSNSAGVSRETEFTELMNNGGTISLTQNGQTATYFFNGPGPFFVDPSGWFVIPAALQTTSTDGPFVFGDPIVVSIP